MEYFRGERDDGVADIPWYFAQNTASEVDQMYHSSCGFSGQQND